MPDASKPECAVLRDVAEAGTAHQSASGSGGYEGEKGNGSKKKKKKKNNKKKIRQPRKVSAQVNLLDEGETSVDFSGHNRSPLCRVFPAGVQCDSFTQYGQTWPPTKPVSSLFSESTYVPFGQILEHPGDFNRKITTDAEKRCNEILEKDIYRKVRIASECHREVRKWAQSWIKPGIMLADMCEAIENKTRELIGENGLKAGIGFPTGCSIDHVAAHYTPNPGDTTRLRYGNVMKVDMGTQIDGMIIDCAWTVAFDPKFDPLVEAVKAATEAGIKAAGIGVRVCDIGEEIQEVMESHEIELDGKVFPIKCCRNLTGHSMEPYNIHAGKSVPIVKGGEATKMQEGEFYAIETFGSTGRGYCVEGLECSHYMKVFNAISHCVCQRPSDCCPILTVLLVL